MQFQPTKRKQQTKKDFDTAFQFVNSVEEYQKDAWNDLTKYVKRKAKSKTDDKIKKARLSSELDRDLSQTNDTKTIDNENILSDDELVYDDVKVKQKKFKSIKTKEDFFDNVSPNEKSTFYEMNLSRPLMKAITEMKFVHPTPIQMSTIPVALLGKLAYLNLMTSSEASMVNLIIKNKSHTYLSYFLGFSFFRHLENLELYCCSDIDSNNIDIIS